MHFGHLRLAVEFHSMLDLAELRFIPVGVPPHRVDALAPAADRLAMLRVAVADQPGFTVDEREIRRPGPAYSVDTLAELRAEEGDRVLCLLLGMDAFVKLPTWHRWREILELAHLCVARRPGAGAHSPADVDAELGRRTAESRAELLREPAGRVLIESVPMLDIAATRIRALIAGHGNPRYLLPEPVLDYIERNGLYR